MMTEEREIADNAFGVHEALHTTNVVSCIFNEHVANHPAVALRPELRAMADEVAEKLGELYQALGNIEGEPRNPTALHIVK